MYYVYILYSRSLDRFYTGFSKYRAKRCRQHVKGRTKWTSRANDWKEVFSKAFPDKASAHALEKKIKARGGPSDFFKLVTVGVTGSLDLRLYS